jgi:hypothetical protein
LKFLAFSNEFRLLSTLYANGFEMQGCGGGRLQYHIKQLRSFAKADFPLCCGLREQQPERFCPPTSSLFPEASYLVSAWIVVRPRLVEWGAALYYGIIVPKVFIVFVFVCCRAVLFHGYCRSIAVRYYMFCVIRVGQLLLIQHMFYFAEGVINNPILRNCSAAACRVT